MKRLFTLSTISLILLFASCQKGLKEKVENEIISKINDPKSYEFVSFKLTDSISNHKYNKQLIDSLTPEINTISYKILSILFDKKHSKERENMESLSQDISLLRRELIKVKKSNFTNTYKKIKLKEIEYKKLSDKYKYQKDIKYFKRIDYSSTLNYDLIIWDSLIKMDKTKLNYYFNEAQPLLSLLYGIENNDSIIKTFKFVDSIQTVIKKTKPITKFYVYEFIYRDKNNFNATVLNKKNVKTFYNKTEIYEIN